MSNYFLGSVGVAEAFYIKRGVKRLAFVARTLTEHSINISASVDDLRAGTGAVSMATFSHDPSIEIKLVDVLWNSAYVEAILGTRFTSDNVADYQRETVFSNGNSTLTYLSKEPISLPFGTYTPNPDSRLTVTLSFPLGSTETKIMINRVGTDVWTWYTGVINGRGIYLPAGQWNVMYMATDEQAREITVTSDFNPAELYLVITTPLYRGNNCAGVVTSSDDVYDIGHLTFEVPRFKVDGNLNFGFNMSSNASIEISGKAMACDTCSCDELRMMRIVEVREDYDFTDELQSISIVPGV